jgi:hypothetical protein
MRDTSSQLVSMSDQAHVRRPRPQTDRLDTHDDWISATGVSPDAECKKRFVLNRALLVPEWEWNQIP